MMSPMAKSKRSSPRPACHRVEPGTKVQLAKRSPRDTGAFDGDKKSAQPVLARLNRRLEALQELLHAEGKRRFLVLLQGMDASGKDGVVRRVFEGVNPAGVQVASFKVPTAEELAHDFLWRAHARVPANGQIVIFNRSHYEDVLVVRVKNLAPQAVWSRRFDQINDFERLLAESGTTILKFFLHVSAEEQRQRLQERIDDPAKRWKFRAGDIGERKLWSAYAKAYEEVLWRTSTPWAPWWIVPADRNWYRDLVIGQILVDSLEGFAMEYPAGEPGIDKVKVT
jgi:PPK2 family polyphosphate:nucleotide phosphotransferase